MMHSVKGGWRHSFALAKHNESEGRKTRIRRSKEERKAMVESFIKKHQEANNGNFPSLNLTHKEVGGSFYTVREIVRDVIQENRVLGPAKFTLDKQMNDLFFEQNPLGSIARDPQPFLDASSNENHPDPSQVKDTDGKMLSVSDVHYTEAEDQVVDNGHMTNVGYVDVTDKGPIEATIISDGYSEHPMDDEGHPVDHSQVDVTNKEYVEATVVSDVYHTGTEHYIADKGHAINGSKVGIINEESDEANIPEIQVSEPVASKQSVEQELAAPATPVAELSPVSADLIVETFPLRSVARTTDGIEGFGESRDSSNSSEKDINMLELEQGGEKSELNGIEPAKKSDFLDGKFEDALGSKKLKQISNTEHDKEKTLGDTLAENANHSNHKENLSHELEDCTDPRVRVTHQNTFENINQSQIKDGAKTSTPNGFPAKNLGQTHTEGPKPSEEVLHKTDKYGVDHQLGGSSHRRSNTTVDRINLESWDGTPKSSAKRDPNPLVAILEAFVNAVLKFWSQ